MTNQQINTNTFGVAKWVVSPNPTQGTHTTIGAALAAASSGDTIFIRNGTYTENLTLQAGVNLTALIADAYTPNVTIVGKLSFSGAGSISISGICLQTNGDYFLSLTGSSLYTVQLIDCSFICSNNTGIQVTNSNSSSILSLYYCEADITSTGIACFSKSGSSQMFVQWCNFENSGGSTTASSFTAGYTAFIFCTSDGGLTLNYSVTGSGDIESCHLYNRTNATMVTCSGTGALFITHSDFACMEPTTSNLIVFNSSANWRITHCHINSTSSSAISGSGTVRYAAISFEAGGGFSVSTKTPLPFYAGTVM